MLNMKKMFPQLHAIEETGITALSRHHDLAVVEGKPGMASYVGEQPKDLISTEFCD